MTDYFDRASEQEEHDRKIALKAQLGRSAIGGYTVADSATECNDCDAPIPMKRREAVPGCRFCVDCQGHREKAFYER